MKKLKGLICVIFAAVLLMGCGVEIGGTPTDKPSITVRYFYAGYGKTYMEEIVKDFNARAQNGEYDFYATPIPDASVSTFLLNALEVEGLAVPDVAFAESFPSLPYGRRGKLVELNEVYDAEVKSAASSTGTMKIKDKINPYLLENNDIEGKFYGLPIQGGVTGLVYNASLFTEYGFAVPQTMAELWALMDSVERLPRNTNGSTADDIFSFIYPSNAIDYWEYLVNPMFMQMMGEDAYYDMLNIESVEGVEADWTRYENVYLSVLGNMQKLKAEKDSTRLTTGQNHTMALAAFAQEKALMTPCGDWSWLEIKNATEPDKLDLMAAPLVCDPVSGLVIANATPSTEVFAGVDMSNAAAVTAAENGYFKIAKNKVSLNKIPSEDEHAQFIYFKKYTYSLGGQMEAVIPTGAKNVDYAKQFLAYMCADSTMDLYTKYTGSNMPYETTASEDARANFYPFNTSAFELSQHAVSIVANKVTKPARYGLAGMIPGASFYISSMKEVAESPASVFDRYKTDARLALRDINVSIINYEKDFIK